MAQTEVHTYAFSVAANTILSLFPFIVMMFTIARVVFHSHAMESAIADMIRYFLPDRAGIRRPRIWRWWPMPAAACSLPRWCMLLISSTGVFLPTGSGLESRLGCHREPLLSYEPAHLSWAGRAIGTIALLSVAVTAAQRSVTAIRLLRPRLITSCLCLCLTLAVADLRGVRQCPLVLPHLLDSSQPKLPVRAVLPTAIVIGLSWELAKMLYIAALPWMDLHSVYGPFSVSVSLHALGLHHRPALARRSPLLGLPPRPPSRPPSRPGTRQDRKAVVI